MLKKVVEECQACQSIFGGLMDLRENKLEVLLRFNVRLQTVYYEFGNTLMDLAK
jgi:hypothetical protein